MSIGPTSQCGTCRHFRSPFSRADYDGGPFCDAFPDGIPDEVYGNHLDHREPITGDNGIQWEADGDVAFPDWALEGFTSTAWLPPHGLPLNIAPEDIDLSRVQRDFERRLDELIAQWGGITAHQRDEIVDQIRSAITSDDVAALARVSVSVSEATEALTAAMTDMALAAAQEFSREAERQGERIDPVASDSALFTALAGVTAALLGEGLTNSASREALHRWSPSTSGDEVAAAVRTHLESLSDQFVRDNLGGALTSAQNTGRLNTALSGPSAALYASEQMDKRTCGPCSAINGKWIGNTDDPDIVSKVEAIYPNGGYKACLGGVRCRGAIVAVYRPDQVAPGEVV